jgi:hypothetical protein
MQITRQVSRIEASAKAIAADDQRVAAIMEEQRQRRAQMTAAKEKLLLDLGHEAGLLDLSASAIARIMAGLEDSCLQESVAAAQVLLVKEQEQPKFKNALPAARALRSTGAADEGLTNIVVKTSRNTATAKREVLQKARLHWNGKGGYWRGRVDAVTVQLLREVFGDRVSVAAEGPSTKATLPAPIAGETGGEGCIEAIAPNAAGEAPAAAVGAPVGTDGASVVTALEAPAAVQGGLGEPPAVAKTPAPLRGFGGPRGWSRPLPRPLPPGGTGQ